MQGGGFPAAVGAMARILCYRCFWPTDLCWCARLRPMRTRTDFVFLMHPKEFKQEKAATGRLTHLCLEGSALHMALRAEDNPSVMELLGDPAFHTVLLYPGSEAINLSAEGADPQPAERLRQQMGSRRLRVVVLDATWSCARKMLKLSAALQKLPRIMFMSGAKSRYVIKQQPQEGCLSTLESVHELLRILSAHGLDEYPDPGQLPAVFDAMQDYQIRCAEDPARGGYRRRAYSEPSQRRTPGPRSRRERYIKAPQP